MNEAQCAYLSAGDSIVAAIARKDANSLDLLDQHFGRGLRFLINRRCSDNDDERFAIVIQSSIETIQAGEISNDSQIPNLLRKLCDKTLAQYPRQVRKSDDGRCDDSLVAALAKKLTIFAPVQLEALRRFYVEGEAASLICQSLGLQSEQFDSICRVALQSAQRTRELRKPSQSADSQRETTASIVPSSA